MTSKIVKRNRKYELKDFDLTNNPEFVFKKLIIDGTCQIDQFISELERDSMRQRYLKRIIAIMDSLRSTRNLPISKFRNIKNSDMSNLFEFKYEDIRIYVVKKRPNVFIALGGYKSHQESDIARLVRIAKDDEFKEIANI